MNTNIIINNDSFIIRIPQLLLKESGLGKRVKLQVKKGEIKIVAANHTKKPINKKISLSNLSEKALAKDWNKPEEDKAWKSLQ